MGIWLTFTDTQSNKLRMYKNVRGVCGRNVALMTTAPKIVAAYSRFTDQIVKIEGLGETKDSSRTGKTQEKNNFKEDLIIRSRKLMGATMSFAIESNSPPLIGVCKLSKSSMSLIRESELLAKLKEFRTVLTDNTIELAGYGITATAVTEYTALIDLFDTLISSTSGSLSLSSAATKRLKEYFAEADKLLLLIDGFMGNLDEAHGLESDQYKEARKIDDLGVRHEDPTPPTPPAPPQEPGTPNP